jgi:hypothetical protein
VFAAPLGGSRVLAAAVNGLPAAIIVLMARRRDIVPIIRTLLWCLGGAVIGMLCCPAWQGRDFYGYDCILQYTCGMAGAVMAFCVRLVVDFNGPLLPARGSSLPRNRNTVGTGPHCGKCGETQLVECEDPVFGHIGFVPDGGIDRWCHLPSGAGDAMVLVAAPKTGPSQGQRDLYSSLRSQLALRESECKAFIAAHEARPANLSDMKIYSVEIEPEATVVANRFVIELSDRGGSEFRRVVYRNGKPETCETLG